MSIEDIAATASPPPEEKLQNKKLVEVARKCEQLDDAWCRFLGIEKKEPLIYLGDGTIRTPEEVEKMTLADGAMKKMQRTSNGIGWGRPITKALTVILPEVLWRPLVYSSAWIVLTSMGGLMRKTTANVVSQVAASVRYGMALQMKLLGDRQYALSWFTLLLILSTLWWMVSKEAPLWYPYKGEFWESAIAKDTLWLLFEDMAVVLSNNPEIVRRLGDPGVEVEGVVTKEVDDVERTVVMTIPIQGIRNRAATASVKIEHTFQSILPNYGFLEVKEVLVAFQDGTELEVLIPSKFATLPVKSIKPVESHTLEQLVQEKFVKEAMTEELVDDYYTTQDAFERDTLLKLSKSFWVLMTQQDALDERKKPSILLNNTEDWKNAVVKRTAEKEKREEEVNQGLRKKKPKILPRIEALERPK